MASCALAYSEDRPAAKLNDLAGRYLLGDPPAARDLSLQEYKALVAKHSLKENRFVREGGDWRAYELVLDSFDDTWAFCGLVTQHKSKAWTWVERYRLRRSTETDTALSLPEIIARRTKSVGGITYGMSVDQVIEQKGRHFRVNYHQAEGSADFVYDDVKVSVRDWWPSRNTGRVVSVEPTTDLMRKNMDRMPYEDEKSGTGKTEVFVVSQKRLIFSNAFCIVLTI